MAVRMIECKSAVSPSRLPGLDFALNPYRGCSHRCAYCYAQDVTRFEMAKPWGEDIEVKVNLVAALGKQLERRSQGVYGIGTVTDPYQPLEKEHELTRGCLSLLRSKGASVSILTKSDLVTRDLDILRGWETAEVGVSIGCADPSLASVLVPGAPPPQRRFEALKKLKDAGIPVYVMAAPIILGLSDSDEMIRSLVAGVREAGVPKVMWDKFNSKPIASSRLRKVLLTNGMMWEAPDSNQRMEHVRSILRTECAQARLELSEAF